MEHQQIHDLLARRAHLIKVSKSFDDATRDVLFKSVNEDIPALLHPAKSMLDEVTRIKGMISEIDKELDRLNWLPPLSVFILPKMNPQASKYTDLYLSEYVASGIIKKILSEYWKARFKRRRRKLKKRNVCKK